MMGARIPLVWRVGFAAAKRFTHLEPMASSIKTRKYPIFASRIDAACVLQGLCSNHDILHKGAKMRSVRTQSEIRALEQRDTLQVLALHDLLVDKNVQWLSDKGLRVGLARLGAAHGGIAIVVSTQVNVWYLEEWLAHVAKMWRGHLAIEVAMRKLADQARVLKAQAEKTTEELTG